MSTSSDPDSLAKPGRLDYGQSEPPELDPEKLRVIDILLRVRLGGLLGSVFLVVFSLAGACALGVWGGVTTERSASTESRSTLEGGLAEHPDLCQSLVSRQEGLDFAVIRRISLAHQEEIRKCFVASSLIDETVAGSLEYRVVMAPGGWIAGLTQSYSRLRGSAEAQDAADRCIRSTLKRWRYTQGVKPFAFSMTFHLEPNSGLATIVVGTSPD